MALVADGWHMSTHAAALGIAALAYMFARRHAHDPRFTFGTGKLGELAGFASAIILGLIALGIGYESASRLVSPVPISLDQATVVAVIGLAVNLGSAWLLFDKDHHEHHHQGHRGHNDHHQHHHDTNLRAAYVHVLADALTSVLAIFGLLSGRFFGWIWMDPLVGIVGAAVIASWSFGLIRSSSRVLLDEVPDRLLYQLIRKRLEVEGDKVADLHLWRLGPGHTGLIASVISDHPHDPQWYRNRLDGITGLSHMTFEVHRCQ
jgi:cation diffusion facilitator family transporter